MRAAVVLGLGFSFVAFVACGSADVDSIFSKDCTKDADCNAGGVCRAGVCLAVGTGGGSNSGGASSTGGAAESGGETASSGGGTSAGGSSSGGTPGSGGTMDTGGAANSGGVTATGGVENSGGHASGGQGPDAGSGGSPSDGGSTGSGGAQETGGSKGSGGSPPAGDGVFCGNRYCPEKQMCCFGIRAGMGVPTPVSSCSADACAGTEIQIACSAHSDCPQSKKCCQVPNSLQAFQCLSDCPAAEIECTGPNVCKDGDVCCETTEGAATGETPTATKCQSQCKGENGSNEYILCHSNQDCPGRLPRCANSNLLAGFKRCWPAN